MDEYSVWYDLRQLTAEVLKVKEINPETDACKTFFSPSEHLDLISRIINTVEGENKKNQGNDYHPWTQTIIRGVRRVFPMTSKHRFMHYLVTSGRKTNGTSSIEIEIYIPGGTPRMDYSSGRSALISGGAIDFTFITYNPKTLEVLEIGVGLKPDKNYLFGRIYMNPVFSEDWAGHTVWSRQ